MRLAYLTTAETLTVLAITVLPRRSAAAKDSALNRGNLDEFSCNVLATLLGRQVE